MFHHFYVSEIRYLEAFLRQKPQITIISGADWGVCGIEGIKQSTSWPARNKTVKTEKKSGLLEWKSLE